MSDKRAYVDRWLIRLCRACGCALGETRAAIALKRCPDCDTPTIPVEDVTDSVWVDAVDVR